MRSADRITERLPSIYKTWDKNSVIFKFLNAFAKEFEEAQKDIRRILRSHWIDTAHVGDLDRLGSLFNLARAQGQSDSDYRDRIKNAIQEFRGGGTIAAIQASLNALLTATPGEGIEIVENPPKEVRVEKIVRAGDIWKMRSQSIYDTTPVLRMKVVEKNAEARSPTLHNLSTGESIRFVGALKTAEELVIDDQKATLDGVDVTDKLATAEAPPPEEEPVTVLTYDITKGRSRPSVPSLPRKEIEWQYTEALSERIGIFDTSTFDEAIYAMGIPEISILFEWTAHPPASFKVSIPKSILKRSGVEEERIERLINSVKAAGVTATLAIEE